MHVVHRYTCRHSHIHIKNKINNYDNNNSLSGPLKWADYANGISLCQALLLFVLLVTVITQGICMTGECQRYLKLKPYPTEGS